MKNQSTENEALEYIVSAFKLYKKKTWVFSKLSLSYVRYAPYLLETGMITVEPTYYGNFMVDLTEIGLAYVEVMSEL
jgi:hypothetical protein